MTKAEPGKQKLTFALDAYDTSKPLVIDPQVIYANYLGGTSTSTVGNEGARGVAVDAQGSVDILGDTISADFPTKTLAQGVKQGFVNALVTKLDPNGQMIYSTFLGGSSFDGAAAIKVDETGAAYIGGSTTSSDFPTSIRSREGEQGDQESRSSVRTDPRPLLHLPGKRGHRSRRRSGCRLAKECVCCGQYHAQLRRLGE